MATRKPHGNSNHRGGTRSNYDEELEQENRNDEAGNRGEPRRDPYTGKGYANPFTERNPELETEKDKNGNVIGEDFGGTHTLKESWSQLKGMRGFFEKVREVGMLSKMDASEVYYRLREGKNRGKTMHSNYMIRMWNKIKGAQTASIATGESIKMLGRAMGAYEHGRSLR